MHGKDFFSEALVEPNSYYKAEINILHHSFPPDGSGGEENNIYVLLTPNGRLKRQYHVI
jgi:hypothetical protein